MHNIPEEAVKAAKDVLYYANPNDVERALTAAVHYMPGVKVKQLEWIESELYVGATTEIGYYYAYPPHEDFDIGEYWQCSGPDGDDIGHFKDIESAKAAAQADYERRILSALEPSAARELALEEAFKAGAEWCNPRRNQLVLYTTVEKAAKAYALSLSSPDHADAGKVEGDGWSMSPPKFHRYPYFVENISGKWCLCKHHGNGSSHTISVHETAREARDAAPASEGAE